MGAFVRALCKIGYHVIAKGSRTQRRSFGTWCPLTRGVTL